MTNNAHIIRTLRDQFNISNEVYTIIREVNRDGTRRTISFFIVGTGSGSIIDITSIVCELLDLKMGSITKNGPRAAIVRGAGMDMAWHTVYRLSRVVYGGIGESEIRSLSRSPQSSDPGYILQERGL